MLTCSLAYPGSCFAWYPCRSANGSCCLVSSFVLFMALFGWQYNSITKHEISSTTCLTIRSWHNGNQVVNLTGQDTISEWTTIYSQAYVEAIDEVNRLSQKIMDDTWMAFGWPTIGHLYSTYKHRAENMQKCKAGHASNTCLGMSDMHTLIQFKIFLNIRWRQHLRVLIKWYLM